jgi:dihydrofolate synthase/folylpolyglutamate synthase
MTASSRHLSPADFLQRRINYERTTNVPYAAAEFKLDRMRRLMHLLGDPHLGVKTVHIAGTKGKGSTAAMAAAILQAAGYRTGLYTSPHLRSVEERVAIDGTPCPPADFLSLAEQVEPAVEQLDREAERSGSLGPTFFEVTTAMAFLRFAQTKVEAAVLEVGLGGRLDSTNVCLPEVCIITSISFDHTKQLGNTLAAIAGEKAGIIKPGVPVVSGVISPEPRDVIAARATAVGAPLIQRGVDYDFTVHEIRGSGHETVNHTQLGQSFDYWERPLGDSRPPDQAPYSVPGTQYFASSALRAAYALDNVRLPMLGSHQAANAAAAIAAVGQLRRRGWSISDDAIRRGLAVARCPARIEQVADSPVFILDVAHNPASIEALLTVLRERYSPRRRILIFASSKDKDYLSMLRLVLPAFDTIFLTQYIHNPRATEAEALLSLAQRLKAEGADGSPRPALHATARPTDALRLAHLVAGQDDLICVTGSFFLAAELRPLVTQARSASEGLGRQ